MAESCSRGDVRTIARVAGDILRFVSSIVRPHVQLAAENPFLRKQWETTHMAQIGRGDRVSMRWVKIEDVGDTEFLIDEQTDKFRFLEENERVIGEGGRPAQGRR